MFVDYINAHMAGFWIALGFVLLVIEVLVLGFSTIVFLFAGLAAIATGLLIMINLVPDTWVASVASFGILTGVSSVLLWKPFKKMQKGTVPTAGSSSDFVGLQFYLQQDISRTKHGTHRYSGVHWTVELDKSCDEDNLEVGASVKVASIDAGILRVIRDDQ